MVHALKTFYVLLYACFLFWKKKAWYTVLNDMQWAFKEIYGNRGLGMKYYAMNNREFGSW